MIYSIMLRRSKFCHKLLDMIEEEIIDLDNVFLGNKAHFNSAMWRSKIWGQKSSVMRVILLHFSHINGGSVVQKLSQFKESFKWMRGSSS